jgi:hypothetical protein
MFDGFWNLTSGEAHQQRNSIRNPIIQVFHSWMCKRILGRMRETKVIDTELNCLYSALIARQPIDPSYLMINRSCCEETSGSGDIGSGCYLSIGHLLKNGYSKKPRASFTWDLSRIWIHEAREIYKWRWERRLQSCQSELTPSGSKTKTLHSREGRLVGGRTPCARKEE